MKKENGLSTKNAFKNTFKNAFNKAFSKMFVFISLPIILIINSFTSNESARKISWLIISILFVIAIEFLVFFTVAYYIYKLI